MHPANVIKIMLQTQHGQMPELTFKVLSRGAGAQFIMSVPHGAINFAVLEVRLAHWDYTELTCLINKGREVSTVEALPSVVSQRSA
jgi:hypothetical protein